MAEGLATGAVSHRRGRPRRADLNRAVSSIYYALFHTLAACGTDLLAGRAKGSRHESAWRLPRSVLWLLPAFGKRFPACPKCSWPCIAGFWKLPGTVLGFGQRYFTRAGNLPA